MSRNEIRDLRQRLVDQENRLTKRMEGRTATSIRPKPGSRRARQERRANREGGGAAVDVFNHPNRGFTQSSAPVAYSYSSSDTVAYQRVYGNVKHPEHGVGIHVQGRQLLSDVTTTATGTELFAGTGLATVGNNTIALSPDRFNGRLALTARTYNRYKFTRVTITYVPRVATSDVGMFSIGYIQDGPADTFATTSFAACTQMDPNMQTSFRKACSFTFRYSGFNTWYTEFSNTTTAAVRQTTQGELIGFPDLTSIGATQHGWLWVDYSIELYQPTLDFGFTLDVKSKEELEAVRKALGAYRVSQQASSRRLRDAEETTEQEIVLIEGRPFVQAK